MGRATTHGHDPVWKHKIPGLGTMFKMLTNVWPLGRGTVSVSGNDIVVE